MSRTARDLFEPRPTSASSIGLGPAAATWAVAWVLGSQLLAALALVATGASPDDDPTIPQLFAAALVGWAVFVLGLVVVSRRHGSGGVAHDLAFRFRPVDAVGVPLGVFTQLVLVPVLYLTLRAWWPDTFSDERLEESARDLADRASGSTVVLLAAVVVVGAPLVEEVVYRGLLQRSMATVTGPLVALLVTSVWFALVHFRPVEYPGLFLAGVVFGACVVVTDRLGPAIVTHAAFNATGLAVVLSNR